MSSFSLPSLPPPPTVVCIEQEGSHTTALSGAFHDIEHSTACRCLSGQKSEWAGLFSDLGKEIQVKNIPDRVFIKTCSKKREIFTIFTTQVSISYYVRFQGTINSIPAMLVLWLDLDFLNPVNVFTMCVYFNGWVKYLTEISHIQLGGTHKTQRVKIFACQMGLGGFVLKTGLWCPSDPPSSNHMGKREECSVVYL